MRHMTIGAVILVLLSAVVYAGPLTYQIQTGPSVVPERLRPQLDALGDALDVAMASDVDED